MILVFCFCWFFSIMVLVLLFTVQVDVFNHSPSLVVQVDVFLSWSKSCCSGWSFLIMIQVLFTWRSPQKSTERKSRQREGVRQAWWRSSRSCGTKSCSPAFLGVVDIIDDVVENVLVLLLPFPREVVTLIALECIVQTHLLIGLNVLSLNQTNELVNKCVWGLCKG